MTLQAHRVQQHDERMRWRSENPNWNPNDLVFPSEVGTPLGHNNLRLHFKKALKRAYGLPRKKTDAIYLHSYEDTKRAAVAGAAQLLRARKVG